MLLDWEAHWVSNCAQHSAPTSIVTNWNNQTAMDGQDAASNGMLRGDDLHVDARPVQM
jgi:hypothetical protein